MEKIKHIRTLLQLITSGVFLYQMIVSFQRFNKHKVIQEKSMTTIDNIKKPVIYICQDNQFNYEKARKIGYQYMSTLALGELNDTLGKENLKILTIIRFLNYCMNLTIQIYLLSIQMLKKVTWHHMAGVCC